MARAEQTTSFRKVKGVPLKDVAHTKSLTLVMTETAMKNGRKWSPDGCALANLIMENREEVRKQLGIGGYLFATAVRGSSTILGFMSGGKNKARRLSHSNGTTHNITGFDYGDDRTFQVGQEITVYGPKGIHRLGGDKRIRPSEAGTGRHGGEKKKCQRRVVGDTNYIGIAPDKETT